jgi:hypothetical protein
MHWSRIEKMVKCMGYFYFSSQLQNIWLANWVKEKLSGEIYSKITRHATVINWKTINNYTNQWLYKNLGTINRWGYDIFQIIKKYKECGKFKKKDGTTIQKEGEHTAWNSIDWSHFGINHLDLHNSLFKASTPRAPPARPTVRRVQKIAANIKESESEIFCCLLIE